MGPGYKLQIPWAEEVLKKVTGGAKSVTVSHLLSDRLVRRVYKMT